MALADGGELVVLAPGVSPLGEDPAIDALIRRHGYRGTPATLAALRARPRARRQPGGGSAPDPRQQRRPLPDRLLHRPCRAAASPATRSKASVTPGARYRRSSICSASATPRRRARDTDRDGEPFTHIANPGLGLWATSERFGSS